MKLKNGAVWPDDKGAFINAHGGGMLWHQGRYYWFGEHKREGWEGRLAYDGVHAYSSTDLQQWRDEGLALTVSDDPASPIVKGCRIERPKVLFNEKTGKFVMWFHSTDVDHTLAQRGVAVADSVTGPYRFLYSRRANPGHWPRNVRPEQQDSESIRLAAAEGEARIGNGGGDSFRKFNILGRDFAGGQMSRDMTLFQDDDGAAYHIYASEHNSTLHIARLSDDFLDHAGDYVRVFEYRWMEAPTLFKRAGRYYLLMSGCTSWAPNPARAAVADSIWGPWTEIGNPCQGVDPASGLGPELTFGCQSTCVFEVRGGGGLHLAMFDRWNPRNFIDSRYVWLPVQFTDAGYRICWQEE